MKKETAIEILEEFREHCVIACIQFIKEEDKESYNEAFILAHAVQVALDHLHSCNFTQITKLPKSKNRRK